MIFALYAAMAIFDLAVLAGTVWLVGWHQWDPWWMLLAMLIIAGSNPKELIKIHVSKGAS